tara:strand:+ start:57 stop:281 length:225 start_codon:yes stop_codon:yes gene_type:complete
MSWHAPFMRAVHHFGIIVGLMANWAIFSTNFWRMAVLETIAKGVDLVIRYVRFPKLDELLSIVQTANDNGISDL